MALAIGANTTIFSVARQLLNERLDVLHAADLRLLSWTATKEHVVVHDLWGDGISFLMGGVASNVVSYPVYQQLKVENRALEDLFAFKDTSMNATVRGEGAACEDGDGLRVLLGALEVRPQLGRVIRLSDDRRLDRARWR